MATDIKNGALNLANQNSQTINKSFVFLFAILSITIAQISWFMYLPSLPSIVLQLHANEGQIQLAATLFCIGMGLSQFLYGPLSDHYGRRPVLFAGLIIFILGSAVASFAYSIQQLIIGRVIQGVGAGACSTLGRVIPRDIFNGKEYIKKSSQLSMALAFIPLASPVLGGYLQEFFDWRASFFIIFFYGLFLLIILVKYFIETNRFIRQSTFSLNKLVINYFSIIINATFMTYLLIGGVTLVGETIFAITAPFFLQIKFGLTPTQYGYVALIIALGFLMGAFCSSKLSFRLQIPSLILYGLVFLFLGGISMFFVALLNPNSSILFTLSMIFFTFGTGFIYPNAAAGAMSIFPEKAGVAGALLGSLQLLFAGLSGSFIAFLGGANLVLLACTLTGVALINSALLTRNYIFNR